MPALVSFENSSMSDVLIVDGARTPMGGLLGDLADATANELGTTAIAATLERASVSPEAVDEVFMGCVLPAGLKQCPARQAMLAAGICAAVCGCCSTWLCLLQPGSTARRRDRS